MKTRYVSQFGRFLPPVTVLAGAPAATRRLDALLAAVQKRPAQAQAVVTEAGPFEPMIDDLVAATRRDAVRFGLGTRERRGDGIAMRDGALAAILLGYEGDQATEYVVAFVERRRVRAFMRVVWFGTGVVIAFAGAALLQWMAVP